MKRTEPKVKFQGKEYRVIYVDFKRQIVHIANGGAIRNVGFKDVSANYKVTTHFTDFESNEVFVGDTLSMLSPMFLILYQGDLTKDNITRMFSENVKF